MLNILITATISLFSVFSFFNNNTGLKSKENLEAFTENLYEGIDFGHSPRPDYDAFKLALAGFLIMKEQKQIGDKDILSLLDFSLSSNQQRMWVIDLKSKKLLYHTWVAHGRNSGQEYATRFSNALHSNQSSLGFYVTEAEYYGTHGISLKLKGVEKGINDKAEERTIVIHGADYVSQDFIRQYGRLGRSLGCPALPNDIAEEIINKIANGTCLFIYYPDPEYLSHSITNYLQDSNLLTDSEPDSYSGH